MRFPAILVVLSLLSISCESGPAPEATPPQGDFVPASEKPAEAPAKAGEDKAASFKGAGKFLPQPEALGKSYRLEQGPEYYTKDTLFEVIDGASDSYIA